MEIVSIIIIIIVLSFFYTAGYLYASFKYRRMLKKQIGKLKDILNDNKVKTETLIEVANRLKGKK